MFKIYLAALHSTKDIINNIQLEIPSANWSENQLLSNCSNFSASIAITERRIVNPLRINRQENDGTLDGQLLTYTRPQYIHTFLDIRNIIIIY